MGEYVNEQQQQEGGNRCLAGQSVIVVIGGHVAQRCMWEVKESEREIWAELERPEVSWTKECGKGGWESRWQRQGKTVNLFLTIVLEDGMLVALKGSRFS